MSRHRGEKGNGSRISVRGSKREKINFARKYVKANKKVEKLHEKNAKLLEQIAESKDKIADLRVEKQKLSSDLSTANFDLLCAQSDLSARGAIELFEQRNGLHGDQQSTRFQKYFEFYNNDAVFRRNVFTQFNRRLGQTEVATIAVKLYRSASEHIHKFLVDGSKAVVRKAKFHPDDLKMLKAICGSLHINLKVE